MSRLFCIPGVAFLGIAFILSLLVSISLPFLNVFDIVRIHAADPSNTGAISVGKIQEVRLGVWSACTYGLDDSRTCLPAGLAYSATVGSSSGNDARSTEIKPSWTRGLAVHPLACAVTIIALLLSLSTNITVALCASIASFFAALVTFVALMIDIALFVLVRHSVNELDIGAKTDPAPGFWLTLITLVLLLLAGCTVCLGRRRDRKVVAAAAAEPSYPLYEKKPGFFSRFRRNRN